MSELLHSRLLSAMEGVEHGFGTRLSDVKLDEMASLRQIHSAECLQAVIAGLTGAGDALITDQPGLAVAIRTADCFPILIADPKRHAVAALHAGWRGTAVGIVVQTIAKMSDRFGTNPIDLHAAIGPGIGECCYQVGEEVGVKFGLKAAGRIDLAAANRQQLIEAGVPETQIEVLGFCTFCDAARFHSWRRDKESAGRMISYIRVL